MAPPRLAAGNWKMHGSLAALAELDAIGAAAPEGAEVMICPPAPLIGAAAGRATGTRLLIGAQDCHAAAAGAHTGDVAAEMLAEVGAQAVILGHSERRADHGESDATVAAKVAAAWRAGLRAILCVGESEATRDAGHAVAVVTGQLRASLPEGDGALVVAYEPVWAIGTGRVPAMAEIEEMHGALRDALGACGGDVPILYGGSVKPGNAAEIFAVPGVDGALVGGASLTADQFVPIIRALSG